MNIAGGRNNRTAGTLVMGFLRRGATIANAHLTGFGADKRNARRAFKARRAFLCGPDRT